MRCRTLAVVAGALLLVLSSCSSDDDAADTTDDTRAVTDTTASAEVVAYCAELEPLGQGDDPGFEQFFADHPEPALEDWAGFLPGVVEQLDGGLAVLEAADPPPEAEEVHTDAVEAATAMRDSFAASLAAAEAGDQATFDAEEEENQSTNSPAFEEALAALGGLCGFEG